MGRSRGANLGRLRTTWCQHVSSKRSLAPPPDNGDTPPRVVCEEPGRYCVTWAGWDQPPLPSILVTPANLATPGKRGENNRKAGARWRHLRYRYPDGGIEGVVVPARGTKRGREASNELAQAPAITEYRDRHRDHGKERDRRAQTRVKRLSRQQDFKRMWHPTFPEACHDYDTAYKILADFLHRYWHLFLAPRAYIAVPELHPDGHGWHFHMLYRRKARYSVLQLHAIQTAWSRHLAQWGYNPEGVLARHKVTYKASAKGAAVYAAKYIGKAIGDGLPAGRKRYICSLGLALPPAEEHLFNTLRQAIRHAQPEHASRNHAGFLTHGPYWWYEIDPNPPPQ